MTRLFNIYVLGSFLIFIKSYFSFQNTFKSFIFSSSKLQHYDISLLALPIGSFSSLPKLPDLSQAEFPDVPEENEDGYNYDIVVFGSGPGGEAASVQGWQSFN